MAWCCYWSTVYLLPKPGNNFATFRYNTRGVLLSENITLVSRRIVFNFVGNILALELWIFLTAFYAFLHTQCVLTIVYFSNPPYLFDFHWETVWDIYLFFKTLKDFFFFYGHELLNFLNHVLCPCWFHIVKTQQKMHFIYI